MDVLQLLAIIFGLAGTAGGAIGFFSKGRGDAIIAYQSKQNELLKNDNARLEKDNTAKTAENARLHAENTRLAEIAKGSHLKGVATDMRANTKAVTKLIEVLTKNGKA